MNSHKTSKDEDVLEVLERLEKRVNADPQFTKNDEATIHEMMQVYKGLLAVGKFSKLLIFALAAIAATMAAYKTVIAGVRSWLIG